MSNHERITTEHLEDRIAAHEPCEAVGLPQDQDPNEQVAPPTRLARAVAIFTRVLDNAGVNSINDPTSTRVF